MRPAAPDVHRLHTVLGVPELAWLVERLRARIERGRPLTGTVTRARASAAERAAVAGILGRAPGQGGSLSVRLEDLDAEIVEAGLAPDLRSAVEALVGPVRSLPDDQAMERERVEAAVAALQAGPHAEADWYQAWVQGVLADGTLTRLARRGDLQLAAHAAAVLGLLPADGTMALPLLAEQAVGDTKALAGTPLARLVLRALALRTGTSPPTSRTAERLAWADAGVVADDLASQVLVLNLRCREEHLVGGWLRQAADAGMPFRLTLHQLTAGPLTPAGGEVFVCENPTVLRTAAADLGSRCAPLVCTEGIPSAACTGLLDVAASAGVRIHWHADLDWTGLRTTGEAIRRFGALPWRMTREAYRAGIERGDSEPLRGAPATSPWAPDLAADLDRHGRAIMEERVLADLLADLAAQPA